MTSKKVLEKQLRNLDQKTIKNGIAYDVLLKKHKQEQKKSTNEFWILQKKKKVIIRKLRKMM